MRDNPFTVSLVRIYNLRETLQNKRELRKGTKPPNVERSKALFMAGIEFIWLTVSVLCEFWFCKEIFQAPLQIPKPFPDQTKKTSAKLHQIAIQKLPRVTLFHSPGPSRRPPMACRPEEYCPNATLKVRHMKIGTALCETWSYNNLV